MNLWNAWVAGWVTTLTLVVAALGFSIWGIWTLDSRGHVAWVFLFGSIALGCAMASWSLEAQPERPPRLPREARRRLRNERSRIAIEAEIARLEREAGIR